MGRPFVRSFHFGPKGHVAVPLLSSPPRTLTAPPSSNLTRISFTNSQKLAPFKLPSLLSAFSEKGLKHDVTASAAAATDFGDYMCIHWFQVVQDALDRANLTEKDLSAVDVTIGPGLGLCLRVGVQKARRVTGTFNLPIVGVHHMEAHALGSCPCSQVVSGGVASNQYVRFQLNSIVENKNLKLVCPPPSLCTDNGI